VWTGSPPGAPAQPRWYFSHHVNAMRLLTGNAPDDLHLVEHHQTADHRFFDLRENTVPDVKVHDQHR